jgi:multiple sugar transport system ATP-binding protein
VRVGAQISEENMAEVEIDRLHKKFGELLVLNDVSIQVEHGEFMVFVGPSGCGKSTLLRSIAGLERPSAGRILIGGEDVTRVVPAQRGIAMVFQSYALYPHMTVRENIAFGMKVAKMPGAEIETRLAEAASTLQIGHLLERKPRELSGGQRQRVAIGRSIVRHPKAFLFDEPLSNLDAELRVQMRAELVGLHDRLGATMIYVTHDQVEAMTMADRIAVFNQGRVEQVGAPLELYSHPCNLFVAGFIGSPKMNLLRSEVVETRPDGVAVALPGAGIVRVPVAAGAVTPGQKITLGMRPEHLALGNVSDRTIDAWMTGQTQLVEHLGGEIITRIALTDGTVVNVRSPGHSGLHRAETVQVGVTGALCYLFTEDGAALPALRKVN